MQSRDANLNGVGWQQITSLGSSTSLIVPAGARVAIVQAQDQAVRWHGDGTAPTASVGMRLAAGDDFFFTGKLSEFKVIEETAGAKLNVEYFS